MTHIRPDIYKAIADNDLNEVIFQDPFSEEARKAKRNLVATSFASVLVAALNLQVTGFLGLQADTGATLASEVTRGLSCLLVCYFLAGFVLTAYIDYAAWKFKRERSQVRPYLELIMLLEGHTHVVGEQIKNATARLGSIVVESDMQSQVEFSKRIREAHGQLSSIQSGSTSLHEEFRPLLSHWLTTVKKAESLSWRLRARFLSFWALDITAPLLLAATAIWKTSDGLLAVWMKVAT